MRNKSKIKESALRSLIRNEIQKIIREQNEQDPEAEKAAAQQAAQEEEPENDRGDVLEKITFNYVKALKNNLQQVSADEMADAISSIMGHFGLGKDGRIQVLQALKGKIQL